MITLVNRHTGAILGTLERSAFATIFDATLERESSGDASYYLLPETLELLRGAGLPEAIATAIAAQIEGSGSAEVGWERLRPDATFRMRGRLLRGGEPAPGLWVQAVDRDLPGRDQFLAWCFTRSDGRFELRLREQDLLESPAQEDDGAPPELYLRVLDLEGDVLWCSDARSPEAAEGDWGELEVESGE